MKVMLFRRTFLKLHELGFVPQRVHDIVERVALGYGYPLYTWTRFGFRWEPESGVLYFNVNGEEFKREIKLKTRPAS